MKKIKCINAVILASLLATILGCSSTSNQNKPSTSKRESTGEYIDDAVITAKLKTEILRDPVLRSYEINVETYKGVVQLSGFVGSEYEIYKAGEIARLVKGVTSVKNDMRIK